MEKDALQAALLVGLLLGTAIPADGFCSPSHLVPQSSAHSLAHRCRFSAPGGWARARRRVLMTEPPTSTRHSVQAGSADSQVNVPGGIRLREYHAASIGAHFQERPWEVVERLVQLSRCFGSAGASALLVVLQGQRGRDLVDGCGAAVAAALAEAGPTYSKFGQALSCRPDLVGDGLAAALQELQDRVPPFDHETAKQIVREELGVAGQGLIESMGDAPIAAATLGQVYRAQVDGKSVALKVQRPGVMTAVAADSFIIRSVARVLEMLRNPITGERLIKPYIVAGWSVLHPPSPPLSPT